MKSDGQKTRQTTTVPRPPVGRMASWSKLVALESQAAAVVAGNRPLPDSARGLVVVAQQARQAPRNL